MYIFYPFFSVVYNQEQLILQTIYVLNKEILQFLSLKSVVSNQDRISKTYSFRISNNRIVENNWNLGYPHIAFNHCARCWNCHFRKSKVYPVTPHKSLPHLFFLLHFFLLAILVWPHLWSTVQWSTANRLQIFANINHLLKSYLDITCTKRIKNQSKLDF